jgi:hypothetical protein
VINPRNLSLLAFSLARPLRIIIEYTFDAVALPVMDGRFFCLLAVREIFSFSVFDVL